MCFEIAFEVGKRSSETDMVVDQEIHAALPHRAVKRRRRYHPLECRCPRMPDLVDLDYLSRLGARVQHVRQYLRHGIGNGIETACFLGHDGKQNDGSLGYQRSQSFNRPCTDEVAGEIERSVRIARLCGGISGMTVPLPNGRVDDGVWKTL